MSYVGEKNNLVTYKVDINGHPATLTTVVDAQDGIPAEIYERAKKFQKKGVPYFAGTDFVVRYDDPQPTNLTPAR